MNDPNGNLTLGFLVQLIRAMKTHNLRLEQWAVVKNDSSTMFHLKFNHPDGLAALEKALGEMN